MNPLTVRVVNGVLTFVHDDALAGLLAAGAVSVNRVSNVEWDTALGGWTAAMVDGPVLGPYALRADALKAERVWLAEHRGL